MIPNIDIDVNKALEVALKYKTQLTFLGVLLLLGLSFYLGKRHAESQKDLTVICDYYIGLEKTCQTNLSTCRTTKDQQVKNAIDKERKECTKRHKNKCKQKNVNNKRKNCMIYKSLAKQCVEKGL